MFYIRQINGRDECRPMSPYMGTDWYEAGGWTLYPGALPMSRVAISGGTQGEDGITRGGAITELPAPALPPRTLSKLKIREKLEALGLWETANPLIEAEAGEYWALAHDVSEAHPKFAALLAQLRPQFEAAGIDLDALLDECVMERY